MSALTRLEDFDDFFPQLFRRFSRFPRTMNELPADIRIDVSETDKSYEVRAEVPGARKEDIHVNVNGNFVSISAEVKHEKEEKHGKRTLVSETYVGRISRGFTLDQEVDAKEVTAKLEDGVLKLNLPKRVGSDSRSITIT